MMSKDLERIDTALAKFWQKKLATMPYEKQIELLRMATAAGNAQTAEIIEKHIAETHLEQTMFSKGD